MCWERASMETSGTRDPTIHERWQCLTSVALGSPVAPHIPGHCAPSKQDLSARVVNLCSGVTIMVALDKMKLHRMVKVGVAV